MMDHKKASAGSDHRIWAPLLAVAALAVTVAGYAYYRAEAERIRQEKYHEIAAVAELKAGQIVEWRRELALDAEKMARSPLLARAVAQYLASPQEAERGDILRERLRTEQIKDLDDALLLDPQGRILLAAKDDPDPLDPTAQDAVWGALAGGGAHLSDLYRCPHGVVHLDVVAPILSAAGQPIALVVLRSDAEHILYPLIQSWPTPSRSAETLLVRREGQSALYLNDLRHQAGAALSLRQPLADSDLPAAQVILGKRGLFQGVDYRGVEVLADLRAIPDSPWFMVAKVDASEILAETNYRARVTALLVGMGVLMAAGAAAYASRQRQAGLYRHLYEAERQEREAQGRFRATLYSIGDGVITTDGAGRVQHMNPVAERLTGWAEAEARGQSLEQVFHIINEETRAAVENPAQRVLREGAVVGLANHTLLLARDGAERPIADSGAPIRDADGEIIGVALVFRDQTAERAVRRALRQWADAFAHCGHGITLSDPATNCILACNPAFARLHRRAVGEIVGVPIASLYAPEERERVEQRNAEADRTGRAQFDAWMIRQDGSTFPAQVDLVSVRDDDGMVLYRVATVEDITERRRAEEEMRESQARFSTVFHASPVAIAITRLADYRFVDVSDAWQKMTGYPRQEVLGRTPLEMNLWVDPAARDRLVEALRERGSVQNFEFQVRRRSGDVVDALMFAELIQVGGEACMLSMALDITARKRAEQELRESEARFSTIFHASPICVAVTRLSDGSLMDVNEAWQEMSGYTREEAIGRSAMDLNLWAEAGQRDRLIQLLREQGAARDYEVRMRRKSGEISDMLFSAGVITVGAEPCMLSIAADITARKRAEEALARERALLRTVIDNLPDAIYVKDLEARKVLANRTDWSRNGAESEEQILGKTDQEIFPPDVAARLMADDFAVLRSGQPLLDREELLENARGELVWLLTSKLPLKDAEGRVIGLVGIGHDITERKRAEEERAKLQAQLVQAQKMEAVGRLAGGVAHDFNNLLGVINGYAEMALEDLDPADPLYADMNEIASAGRRSANLTRQLLAFARQQTIAPKSLDLNEAVGGMLKMLQRLIGEDIDLVWKPATPLWPVLMDPAQIDQILANLAVNARDAIAGVGKLTIETAQVEFDEAYCREHLYTKPGQYVMLAVSDNGCGMDKETMARIFEPFFTTKPQGQGTGLGLATVYGIVKQNNGFINVYSELGRGSTFKVYLPRCEAEGVVAADQSHPQAATGAETVLLVEDDPALLKSSARMVELLGYTVLEANGPAEALRLAQEYAGVIHLLMTDVVMPGMSGRDLHQQIGALRPEIKCLYMSGYTANVIAHHGVLDPGIHFLAKPFTRRDLAAKLREALA